MDTARLAEALGYLITDEDEFDIQGKLTGVRDALNDLSGNPAEPSYQKSFAEKFEELSTALSDLLGTYNPSQKQRIFALAARPYFSQALTTRISNSITQNPLSPSVTLDLVNKLISQRQSYLDRISQTKKGLEGLGLDETELEQGEADVGFEIPREIFDNKLSGLIKELRTVQRIIRVFSEVKTGEVAEIEVHDISASNPLFFLGMDPVTIGLIGGAVTWALHQWKTVEEIRKVRTETKKLTAFSEPEVKDFFDAKIESIVEAAVKKEAKTLLDQSPLDAPRRNELTSEVEWALRALFARIERGMKVEIRFNLPEPEEGKSESKDTKKTRDTLEEVRTALIFPKIDGSPILSLPSVKDADPYKPTKKRTQQPRRTRKSKQTDTPPPNT